MSNFKKGEKLDKKKAGSMNRLLNIKNHNRSISIAFSIQDHLPRLHLRLPQPPVYVWRL